MENCFKIHGYPDWYKRLKNQRSQGIVMANLANTSSETPLVNVEGEEFNREDIVPHTS